MRRDPAFLVLEDGEVFEGIRLGAAREAAGEVVFTTSMTGYREVISDPSYRGQIVVMAYPLVGNYGVSPQAWEAPRPHVAGFVMREACAAPSHYRSSEALHALLARHGVTGLAGVDKRRLVRHLRTVGLRRGVIMPSPGDAAVVSTPTRGGDPTRNGFAALHRAALERHVPCVTSLETARVIADVLATGIATGISLRPLQHTERSSGRRPARDEARGP